jgi:hypothetical protein
VIEQGHAKDKKADDPGVPEALPRTLVHLRDRLGVERVDRLWIFPPLRRGRRERGVVAVSLFGEDGRRRLLTLAYSSERSGLDLTLDHTFHEEGEAPPELLPRVMEGVVRRAGGGQGDPRQVEIEGEAERYEALVGEFDPSLYAAEPQ